MFDVLEGKLLSLLQAIFDQSGWLGVAALMAFENATSITPSEVILGMAGWFLIAAHQKPSGTVFLGGLYAALGSVAGASVPYWLARLGGRPLIDRLAGWLHIPPALIDQIEAQFRRWGPGLVFFGRLAPGVRVLVSLPAGLARMPYRRFWALTFAGAYLWCTLLIGAGYFLGYQWPLISDLVKRYTLFLLPAAALLGGAALWLSWRKFQSTRRLAALALPTATERLEE